MGAAILDRPSRTSTALLTIILVSAMFSFSISVLRKKSCDDNKEVGSYKLLLIVFGGGTRLERTVQAEGL